MANACGLTSPVFAAAKTNPGPGFPLSRRLSGALSQERRAGRKRRKAKVARRALADIGKAAALSNGEANGCGAEADHWNLLACVV